MYVNSAHQSVHIEGQLLRLCRMMQNAEPQEFQDKGGRFIGRSVNSILTRGGGQIIFSQLKFRYSEKAQLPYFFTLLGCVKLLKDGSNVCGLLRTSELYYSASPPLRFYLHPKVLECSTKIPFSSLSSSRQITTSFYLPTPLE